LPFCFWLLGAWLSYEPRISPPLHDGGAISSSTKHQSDKKFFGPPFPADYPEDKRPVPDQSILNKLKGPGQPYPALQSKADFDRDYVKDENSDTGSWKAQFEYDTLRNKMAKEAADAKRAAGQADKEGADADSAQGRADQAAKDVEDAKKALDDDLNADKEHKTPEEFEEMAPSDKKLKELKAAVKAAEENLEKEKKEFEECKKALEEAQKNLEELKAKQVEMEAQLAADTKLWVEQKAVKLSAQKAKEEAAHTKRVAADSRLKDVQGEKAGLDKILAEKKAIHDKGLKALQKEQQKLADLKESMAKATLTLQKLRGYKPADAKPLHASAPATVVSVAVLAVMAAFRG